MLAVIGLFIILFPKYFAYFNGVGLHSTGQYYFEPAVIYGTVFGIIGLVLVSLYQLRTGNFESKYIFGWIGLLIPALYYISGITAASNYMSNLSTLFQVGLYGFLVMGIFLSKFRNLLKYFMNLYFIIGLFVVVYSISYLIGNQYKLDALSYVNGVRIASVFTYANAYATFILTLLIINLHYLVTTRVRVKVVLLGATVAVLLSSLLLTLSRGALIALPIIILIMLLTTTVRQQLLMAIYSIVAMPIAVYMQMRLETIGNNTYNRIHAEIAENKVVTKQAFFTADSLQGWGVIILCTLLMVVVVYTIHRFALTKLENAILRWEIKAYARSVLPLTLVLVMVGGIVVFSTGALNGLLPNSLFSRLSDISFNTHSVLERLTIYQDALRLLKDNLWLGAGGGAWEVLYDTYQTYPYISSQTHSYPVQLLVESGVLGLLFVGGYLGFIYVRFAVKYIVKKNQNDDMFNLYFLVSLSIIIHSLIDFEMSYFFFSAVVFLCAGVLIGVMNTAQSFAVSMNKAVWWNRSVSVVWLVIAITCAIFISNSMKAHGKFDESVKLLQEGQTLQVVSKALNDGLNKYPNQPQLLERAGMLYMNAYQETSQIEYKNIAFKYFDRLKATEPYMKSLNMIFYVDAMNDKDYLKAAQLMEEAIRKNPFEISYYECAMNSYYQLYELAKKQSNQEEREATSKAIRMIYNQAEEKVHRLNTLNRSIIYFRTFAITDGMSQIYDSIQENNK